MVAITTRSSVAHERNSCDLLKNIYLCGSNNNDNISDRFCNYVVICLKISIFVVAITTVVNTLDFSMRL